MAAKDKKQTVVTEAQPAEETITVTKAQLRMICAELILDLYKDEEFVLDVDDNALATKYANRMKQLEARVAVLEGAPATGTPERVDASKLARGAKK